MSEKIEVRDWNATLLGLSHEMLKLCAEAAQHEILDPQICQLLIAAGQSIHQASAIVQKNVTGDYQEYLKSNQWRNGRSKALIRDAFECQDCGHKWQAGEPPLHVHHLSYDRRGQELLEDLVSLCERCHEKAHPAIGAKVDKEQVPAFLSETDRLLGKPTLDEQIDMELIELAVLHPSTLPQAVAALDDHVPVNPILGRLWSMCQSAHAAGVLGNLSAMHGTFQSQSSECRVLEWLITRGLTMSVQPDLLPHTVAAIKRAAEHRATSREPEPGTAYEALEQAMRRHRTLQERTSAAL